MDEDTDVHLRWNEHQTTLLSVFSSLLNNENLVDCTISAEGQHFKAHRLILSACSPYFELIFTEHSEMHPVVILPDVKFQILKPLMEFMYSGEVKIPQDKFRTILELADTLQIKGLSSIGDNEIKDDLRPKRRNEPSILCGQQSFKKHMSEHRSGSQGKQRDDDSSLHSSGKEHSEDIDPTPLAAQNCFKSNSNSDSPKRTVEEAVMFQYISDTHAFNMLHGSHVTKTLINSNTQLSGIFMNSDSNILDSSHLSRCNIVEVGEHRLSSENDSSTHLSSEALRTSASLGVSGERPADDLLPQLKQDDPDDFTSNSIEEIILGDDTDENDDHSCISGDDNNSTVVGRVIPEDSFSGQGFCNVEQYRDTYFVEQAPLLLKQFKCNACPRSYRNRESLSRHLRLECGKEPQYKCPHCPFRCLHNHNLKKHIVSKHSALMFKPVINRKAV